jgi:hypothetical protein
LLLLFFPAVEGDVVLVRLDRVLAVFDVLPVLFSSRPVDGVPLLERPDLALLVFGLLLWRAVQKTVAA